MRELGLTLIVPDLGMAVGLFLEAPVGQGATREGECQNDG